LALSNKLQINLTGVDIRESLNNIVWETTGESVEKVLKLKASDNKITLDISVSNIKVIYLYSDDTFSLEITTVSGITTSVATVETSYFLITPSTEFADTITSIKISTASTSDIIVNFGLYGTIS
jgi:hypothetical protein